MVRSQSEFLLGYESVNCPGFGGAVRKKTMLAGGFHNNEVLNCQQECENDAIKGS